MYMYVYDESNINAFRFDFFFHAKLFISILEFISYHVE